MPYEIDLKGHARGIGALLAGALLLGSATAIAASPQKSPSLAGTWTLVAADKELAYGSRVRDQLATIPRAV